jgi:hypothetical protein
MLDAKDANALLIDPAGIPADEGTVHVQSGVTELLRQRQMLLDDLEAALQLVWSYQRQFSIAQMPDPSVVKARQLLTKWGMPFTATQSPFRIFADGKDITEHPDSIEGTTEEQLSIEGLDEPERAELVADEHGDLRLIPETNDD